jgi:hypothetical protein
MIVEIKTASKKRNKSQAIMTLVDIKGELKS